MKVATAANMKLADAHAVEELKIPSLLLMETAAAEVCKICECEFQKGQYDRIVIFAGSGNNGGDGLALARMLSRLKLPVYVVYTGTESRLSNDTRVQFDIIRQLKIPLAAFHPNLFADPSFNLSNALVVDAVLGVGLRGIATGRAAEAINAINASGAHVISIDIPSGIQADTGEVDGPAVKAHKTVTFCLPKIGLLMYPAAEYAGEIIVSDIGIPSNILESLEGNTFTVTAGEFSGMLPRRSARSNKGCYGKLLVVAGSREMPGAAILCCRAATKTGTGLVCAALPENTAMVLQSKIPECITKLLPERGGCLAEEAAYMLDELICNYSSVAIGPGLGLTDDVQKLVRYLLQAAKIPTVLDADGLNAIEPDNLPRTPACIITPHPGEMSRLTGLTVAEILRNPLDTAREFAKKYGVTVVLKDAHTVVAAPDGTAYINTTGCPAMAKAGAGDVLTGIIAGFLAQGLSPLNAAVAGVYAHGLAGELAAADLGGFGVLPEDIAVYAGKVLQLYSPK